MYERISFYLDITISRSFEANKNEQFRSFTKSLQNENENVKQQKP